MASEKNPFLIEYTVGLNYITPAVRQKIGVAGNHNAVELEFEVDEALSTEMENNAQNAEVRYRFEVYNGASEVFRTETQKIGADYKVIYSLQERDTRYGGGIRVVLVLTAFDGSEVVQEVFCPPALLQVVEMPHGVNRVSHAELEQKALRAAEAAAEAADYVRQIKEAYDSGELKGDTGEQGPQGIQGPQGDPGKDYVLTDEDRVEIAETVIGNLYYYADLNTAINAINNDTIGENCINKDAAVVSIRTEDGVKIITILEDAEVASLEYIIKTMTIDLNGKTLSISTGVQFRTNDANAVLTVVGNGGKIIKNIETTSTNERLFYAYAGAIKLLGGEYTSDIQSASIGIAMFQCRGGATLDLKDCSITLSVHGSSVSSPVGIMGVYGVANSNVNIENCTISGNVKEHQCICVYCLGELQLINSTLTAHATELCQGVLIANSANAYVADCSIIVKSTLSFARAFENTHTATIERVKTFADGLESVPDKSAYTAGIVNSATMHLVDCVAYSTSLGFVDVGTSTVTGTLYENTKHGTVSVAEFGVPSETTVAAIGQLYLDISTGALYKCTAVKNGVCTWSRYIYDLQNKTVHNFQNQPTSNFENIDYEKYFDITESGVAFLKNVYRGAVGERLATYDGGSNTLMGYGEDVFSDKGRGIAGSKNHELPDTLYVPAIINNTVVTELALGAFAYNYRIKHIVLHPNIKKLNGYTFYKALNLETITGTECITTIGRSEFMYTRLKKIELPNLTGALPDYVFGSCPLLEYVDIGYVRSIGASAFYFTSNLKEIKIDAPVETINKGAFFYCYSLPTVDNLIAPGITKYIGDGAFTMARPTYDWSTLTDCEFGTYATSEQRNPNKFWEGVSFQPCENKTLSFLSQFDLRWQDLNMNPNDVDIFGDGCAAFAVMGCWCSLNDVAVTDARDFINICKEHETEFHKVDNKYHETLDCAQFYEAMGLDVSYIYRADFTPAGPSLTNMYNALADGKYIVFTIPSAYSPTQSGLVDIAQLYLGHAIAITGVTPKGEFIVQDSGAQGFWQVGLRNNSVGRIPAQNLINYIANQDGITGAILSKKEAT